MFDEAEAVLTTSYATVANMPTGTVPAPVTGLLLQLIMSLLGNCQAPPATIVTNAQQRTALARYYVGRTVRRELRDQYGIGGYRQHNGPQLEEAILLAGKQATIDQINALLEHVGGAS